MKNIQTINPHTEEVLNRYTFLTNFEAEQVVDKGHVAYQKWRLSSFVERKRNLLSLAKHLRIGKTRYAHLIALEMGKPIALGEMEIEKCAWVCEYYAEHGEQFLSPRIVKTDMKKSLVCHQPLGVIFAIMPWNFPFWQVFRCAAPCIMAGNVMILKHAPNSCGTSQMIESLFTEAGFPKHVFQSVILDNEGAAKVIAHPSIKGVTFTGSEAAGRKVASLAGQFLKKVVLELGGNDPYIVLEDADLELSASSIVTSRLNNAGQVCVAAKRAIVVEAVKDELIDKIKQLMSAYTMGDPLLRSTKIGPMARVDLRQTLHQQVLQSINTGATLVLGGEIPKGCGYYYPPTLLTNVTPGMPAFDDELFGPVISVTAAVDEKMAISLANLSRFGLGAAVFTRDLAKGEAIACLEIESGICFVNAMVASDPRLPFGGIKHSGFGRELSQEGILEFVNIKTVGIHE